MNTENNFKSARQVAPLQEPGVFCFFFYCDISLFPESLHERHFISVPDPVAGEIERGQGNKIKRR